MSGKNTQNDDDISELIQELKNGFIGELPERLDSMESTILSMEKNERFSENYESLYRQTHNLKGLAGTYGLIIITSICHALEDVLNEIGLNSERFSEYSDSYWLKYVDMIRSVHKEITVGATDFLMFEKALTELQSTQPDGGACQLHCMVVTTTNLYENLLPSYFSNENIKFSFSNDSYKALGRLLTEDFDLLISDYETPFLNGLALFGALRMSDCKNKHIKTMLLTSKEQGSFSRETDPEYVIYKDDDFLNNMSEAIHEMTYKSDQGN